MRVSLRTKKLVKGKTSFYLEFYHQGEKSYEFLYCKSSAKSGHNLLKT